MRSQVKKYWSNHQCFFSPFMFRLQPHYLPPKYAKRLTLKICLTLKIAVPCNNNTKLPSNQT